MDYDATEGRSVRLHEAWKNRPPPLELDAAIAAQRSAETAPLPERAVEIRRKLDASMAALAGPDWRDHVRGADGEEREMPNGADNAFREAERLINIGNASEILAEIWDDFATDGLTDSRNVRVRDGRAHPIVRGLPEESQASFDGVTIVETSTLGHKLAGAALQADGRRAIVIGMDSCINKLETAFLAGHLLYHAREQLTGNRYSVRLEFRRTQAAELHAKNIRVMRYRIDEAAADDFAACILYPEYGSTKPARLLALPASCAAMLGTLLQWPHDERGLRLRIYHTHLAVVRDPRSTEVYVIWLGEDWRLHRLWVPSPTILSRLDLSDAQVALLNEGKILAYPYDGLLIDPTDVEKMRAKIHDKETSEFRPGTGRSRTPGLDMDVPVPMPALTTCEP